DAASHQFSPDSFDLVFSRFGVMFFDDPAAAFANLHQAMQAGGQLAFCCWQAMQDNAWTWIPIQAALQHLPPPEPTPPGAPGPFAFADPERVKAILGAAGFDNISIDSFATTLNVSEAPSLGESVRDLATIGPVARLLTDQPTAILEQVFEAMEQVLEPHYNGRTLALPGAVWFVTATST
ncbi:MAG: class I SAM-dependent methyltransferase, partial [Gammaproteobacteria bacterium]|nr:class I SAM-dependent methyltransferase [Gammaproteobacteria bacterium]